jgi:hypothetical protein
MLILNIKHMPLRLSEASAVGDEDDILSFSREEVPSLKDVQGKLRNRIAIIIIACGLGF